MVKFNSLIQDCFFAGGIILVALLLMLGLDPWLGMTGTPFLIFFGAVPIAALYLGRRGGILATVFSALLANYFFIPPANTFSLGIVGSGRTLIFLVEGILISVLIGALRQSQRQTRQSLQQLKASESKFRRLVDSNIIGVASCDIYGAISEANDSLLKSLGYTREDLLAGRIRWDEMTPPDLKHLDKPAYEELITKGKNTPYEKAFIGKQGQRVPVIVGAALLEDDPEQLVSFILDVSDRKRVEDERRQAEQRLAVQYAIARVLADATTLANAVPLLLQSLCENLNWQVGFFWRVDPQNQRLKYIDGWHSPNLRIGEWRQANETMTIAPGEGLLGQTWKSGQPAWTANSAQTSDDSKDSIAYKLGLHSALSFPVSLNQEVLGVIECYSIQYRKPDDNLLHMMQAIGSQIGQFMERKQTEEELQASQALFESFMNHCPINAYIKDESGRYVYVNPTIERGYHRPLSDWVGKTDFDFFAPEVAQVFRENDLAVLQTGQVAQILEENPLDDEKTHYLSFKFPLRDAMGRLLLGGMTIDVSDRKRLEAERERLLHQLENSLGQLEAVINNMTEGLVIADLQGNILTFNPAALALHGYESLEQVQRHLHEFPDTFAVHDFQGNLIPVEQWPIGRALQGKTFANHEVWVERRDTGKAFIGSYSGTPVRNKQGQIILAIVTVRDVTEQKQAQAELARSLAAEQAARVEAEAANRIKDEFLAVLSHELRTPLNPILGWTTLLRSRKVNEQKIDFALETIERNTKLQIQLIDDLLDISRILQGKLALNVSPTNLSIVIEAAKETMRLASEAKAIEIRTELEPFAGAILGDSNRLQQVVWNLLSNAVKFTPAGGKIDIRLNYAGSFAHIIVKDTGKGIPPEFLPHIFEYFTQADSSTTRKFGGLGLGLAIAHRIVELHGGTIKAESEGEGKGATFTVKLPLLVKDGEVQPEETNSELLTQPPLPLAAIRVLAIDDEADNLELIQFTLEEAGATVVACQSPNKALQHLVQHKPDILITDIGMPELDGYTLIRQVRKLPPEQGGQIPAIALTAYAAEYDQQQALESGFQRHLAKPVEPENLIRAIVELAENR